METVALQQSRLHIYNIPPITLTPKIAVTYSVTGLTYTHGQQIIKCNGLQGSTLLNTDTRRVRCSTLLHQLEDTFHIESEQWFPTFFGL